MESVSLDYLKKIKGIIFDCDGVLIDSINSNIWYYNQFKKKFGLKPLTDEEIKYVHAHTVFESIKYIIPEESHEEALAIRKDPMFEKASDYIKLAEDLVPFLEYLKSASILMAVNTNRTDSLDYILDKFELQDFFDLKVNSTLLPKSKPHPDGVYYILEKWGITPENAVYIGDTWIDEECAKAAGVAFWAYRNADLDSDMHITDYRILMEQFKTANCKA
ncbi:HAD family hydrolase [Maridesulfovibrio bastinii]|uniref:HAD family hydrolase n=1 Tax=Maridesulfovibrio bastinii TaxID=47157 RepID=UPI00040FD172|nr:HAD family hydrolase [Maridesulfovibrio bastinii]